MAKEPQNNEKSRQLAEMSQHLFEISFASYRGIAFPQRLIRNNP
jgi:hypothetical protein